MFLRFFRLGKSREVVATDIDSDFDDPPPPYVEKSPDQEKLTAEDGLVLRLQCFITRLLVTNYEIQGNLGGFDDNDTTSYYEHYLDLCKKYCMLLGMQFATRKEVLAVKRELLRIIFEPARVLGIPADVMEWFLFFTRYMDGTSLLLSRQSLGMLLCLVIDYTILIDVAVKSAYPSLAFTLKGRCVALHQLYFPWMLDPRLIDLDQMAEAQNDIYRHLGCLDESIHKEKAKDAHKLPSSSSSSTTQGFPGKDTHNSPNPSCSQFPDSHISCIEFSSQFPSFLLPCGLYTSWPLVTCLFWQSRRPCGALASPSTSQDLYISQPDFEVWRQRVRRDPKTTFRPRCKKIPTVEVGCELPNVVNVAKLRFRNPEGGRSGSVVVDDGNEWEAVYVRDHLPISRYTQRSLKVVGKDLSSRSAQQSFVSRKSDGFTE